MVNRVMSFTLENQGSTDYLVIQLSGLCPDYRATPVVFCVGLWSQLLGLCSLSCQRC